MSTKTNNLFALSLLFIQPIFMASNLVVARGGVEYVPPISFLVFIGVYLAKKKNVKKI